MPFNNNYNGRRRPQSNNRGSSRNNQNTGPKFNAPVYASNFKGCYSICIKGEYYDKAMEFFEETNRDDGFWLNVIENQQGDADYYVSLKPAEPQQPGARRSNRPSRPVEKQEKPAARKPHKPARQVQEEDEEIEDEGQENEKEDDDFEF